MVESSQVGPNEFDVKVAKGAHPDVAQINLPSAVGRALISAGYTRAKITIEENGILIRPYRGYQERHEPTEVVLPDWQ